ncbi:MAG: sugar ABC transporter ATP-binding protein [Nitrosomonadaceae bacterium]|nr:sugar ABC transporter ATP-binding protein [Nitrosomonadaceae bacterium]|tara:strand:- start:394 stop:1719 length:1326 start_codon:yes stop_codon:yes gene_type:complete
MDTKTAISISNVSKKFRLFSSTKERLIEALHPFRKNYHREFWALKDVSFDVRRGEVVGVLGRNGSGKSTLLQIICSVMQATQGSLKVSGRISALLELGAGFNPDFTGRENVILNGEIMGVSRKDMLSRLSEIEKFADIGEFFDQPVKTYSSGMYVRVAFGAAIHIDPDILIVDEALSVGDSAFQHRCYQKIRAFVDQGKTILVVSHNTETLLRICHRGIILDEGQLKYIGPINSAVDYYHNLLFGSQAKDLEGNSDKVSDIVDTNKSLSTSSNIGSLSTGSNDKIPGKSCYNPQETRFGNGAVRIVDFDLVVDGEINPPEIQGHKETELFVKVLFNKDLEDVSFGFAIVTTDGIYIAGTNSEMMGKPYLTAKSGECRVVKLRWKSHFIGGEHFLNIGCHQIIDGEKTFLDVRRSLAMFKFTDTPGAYGFVDLEMEPEVVEI